MLVGGKMTLLGVRVIPLEAEFVKRSGHSIGHAQPKTNGRNFSELIRTHKHEVCLFNKYHAVYFACKKIISKLITENYSFSLSSRIIGFTKVTSLKILTHLITEYAEYEDEDVQEIDWKTKEHISGKTLFEEFFEKLSVIKKQ